MKGPCPVFPLPTHFDAGADTSDRRLAHRLGGSFGRGVAGVPLLAVPFGHVTVPAQHHRACRIKTAQPGERCLAKDSHGVGAKTMIMLRHGTVHIRGRFKFRKWHGWPTTQIGGPTRLKDG